MIIGFKLRIAGFSEQWGMGIPLINIIIINTEKNLILVIIINLRTNHQSSNQPSIFDPTILLPSSSNFISSEYRLEH